ncbi:MAG: PAS domain-containing protein [Kiloniellaceae bacterium]
MTLQGDIEVVGEPPLRELYLYWFGKRGQRGFPARADIVPEEIKKLLPFIMLVDVLDDGRHFRFRLVGTDVAVGIDPTGKLQHEAVPDGIYHDHITALFRRGAAGPGALYSRSSYGYTDLPGPRSISRLFMPLAADGVRVDMMVIGQQADRAARRGPSAWQANPPTITEELEVRLP